MNVNFSEYIIILITKSFIEYAKIYQLAIKEI